MEDAEKDSVDDVFVVWFSRIGLGKDGSERGEFCIDSYRCAEDPYERDAEVV